MLSKKLIPEKAALVLKKIQNEKAILTLDTENTSAVDVLLTTEVSLGW